MPRHFNPSLLICSSLLFFFIITVTSQKATGKQKAGASDVEQSSIFLEITKFFVEAENWAVPYLPVPIAFLDLILAIDTCASYRKHMGKDSHPVLQVVFVTGFH
jgi:hypothetical protein